MKIDLAPLASYLMCITHYEKCCFFVDINYLYAYDYLIFLFDFDQAITRYLLKEFLKKIVSRIDCEAIKWISGPWPDGIAEKMLTYRIPN